MIFPLVWLGRYWVEPRTSCSFTLAQGREGHPDPLFSLRETDPFDGLCSHHALHGHHTRHRFLWSATKVLVQASGQSSWVEAGGSGGPASLSAASKLPRAQGTWTGATSTVSPSPYQQLYQCPVQTLPRFI
ncbi:uncharacterized protein PV07_08563 [Cladophialophora immunda]|uniref:Uncharacterized protein n=1 Tax=Cladophialophora immunda TaxID=569365 RepID=A0A0D2C4G9_9EURO|nr:uncharacterized protein PV07_08563 [Cladophialophora immunda]KIW25380.1 hypothetical protein PV07_08563 [Cladophialophora immunda]